MVQTMYVDNDDELLQSLCTAAQFVRNNVWGMSKHDKDGIARLAHIGLSQLPTSSERSAAVWLEAANAFAGLSPGARSEINRVLNNDIGLSADSILRSKLEQHGHAPVVPTGKGSSGCPLAASVMAATILFIISIAVKAASTRR